VKRSTSAITPGKILGDNLASHLLATLSALREENLSSFFDDFDEDLD
jgi:hypothetical protein